MWPRQTIPCLLRTLPVHQFSWGTEGKQTNVIWCQILIQRRIKQSNRMASEWGTVYVGRSEKVALRWYLSRGKEPHFDKTETQEWFHLGGCKYIGKSLIFESRNPGILVLAAFLISCITLRRYVLSLCILISPGRKRKYGGSPYRMVLRLEWEPNIWNTVD